MRHGIILIDRVSNIMIGGKALVANEPDGIFKIGY